MMLERLVRQLERGVAAPDSVFEKAWEECHDVRVLLRCYATTADWAGTTRALCACARAALAAVGSDAADATATLAIAERWSGTPADASFESASRASAAAEAAFVDRPFGVACAFRCVAEAAWTASSSQRGHDAATILRHVDDALDAAIKALALARSEFAPPLQSGGVPVLFRDVLVDAAAQRNASRDLAVVVRRTLRAPVVRDGALRAAGRSAGDR